MADVKQPADDLNDGELLREYARTGSQEAFARLVRQHVDKVYSAALRQVHRTHQADEVTQAVFIALARKAPGLSGKVVIGGWLMKATHLAVKNLRRIEARRHRHELYAAQQRTLDMTRSESNSPDPPSDTWNGISPLLDGALAMLPESVRDALILRYLEGRDFAGIARVLGISEEAARKRVERGLEKLRLIFAARGITIPAEVLGETLLLYAVHPAPAKVVHAAAGAAAAVKHLTLAKGVVTVMAWSKVKIAAVCAAGILLVGGTSVVVHKVIAAPRDRIVIAPTGSEPAITTVAPAGGFEMRGQVFAPDGSPVAGARVLAHTGPGSLKIFMDPRLGTPPPAPTIMTGADGSFQLTAPTQPRGVVVTCPQGIARATAKQLADNPRLQLIPWARIEGDVELDGVPGKNAQLLVSYIQDEPRVELNAMTDASGHYVVPEAPPGKLFMSCNAPGDRFLNGMVMVSPGGTATADFITRNGRTLVAHLGPVPTSGYVTALLNLDPTPPSPGEGHFELDSYQQDCTAQTGAEIRFPLVPPGKYRLSLNLIDGKTGKDYAAEKSLTVPSLPAGAAPTEVDAGTLTLKTRDEMRSEPSSKAKPVK